MVLVYEISYDVKEDSPLDIKSDLVKLLIRMEKAKDVTEWSLENCDEDEKQNIIWIDCRIDFWITEMHSIMRKYDS